MDSYEVVGHPEEIAGRHPITGHVVDGYRVRAQHTETGAVAQVFIPHNEYHAANVDLQLRHQFGKHHEVMALGSEPVKPD